jgi:hypothetical protein
VARRRAEPVDPQQNRIRGFGNRPFEQRHDLPAARQHVWDDLLRDVAPPMASSGYTIVNMIEPELLVFELTDRSSLWALFGLVAFMASEQTTRVVISLEEHAFGRTLMIVRGSAPRSVRKAFALMSV